MTNGNLTINHSERLFPGDQELRKLSQSIYESTKGLPILSPHGHTDPAWFASNEAFANPAELFVKPDHYVFRMLHSQGIPLQALGIGKDGEKDPQVIWQTFADNYYLFRGTPSRIWLDSVFNEVFGIQELLTSGNAKDYYDKINKDLQKEEFKPRALFDRFNIEVLCTTDDPCDDLGFHKTIADSDWKGKVIPCFRPDRVVDPEHEEFGEGIKQLGEITNEDTEDFSGYLSALRKRRLFFKEMGATSTDHGHPTALAERLDDDIAAEIYRRATNGDITIYEAESFRAHMLMEMAAMSVEDGLVMQLHPGSFRNHNKELFQKHGRDVGADIPIFMEYTRYLMPILNEFGNNPNFSLIVFTLDESTYSRELAPLAGHYPALKLGPAWWFHDSPEGMRRYREHTTETAGFYNTVGFNDDTRAFLSIPARHDMARRMDAGYLATLVGDHRLTMDEAMEVAQDLAYNLAKKAYKL